MGDPGVNINTATADFAINDPFPFADKFREGRSTCWRRVFRLNTTARNRSIPTGSCVRFKRHLPVDENDNPGRSPQPSVAKVSLMRVEFVGQSSRDLDNVQADPSRLLNCYRESVGSAAVVSQPRTVACRRSDRRLCQDPEAFEGSLYTLCGGVPSR